MSEEELSPEDRIAIAKAAAEANHAAAERERAEANHVRAETDKEREHRLAVEDTRKDAETRKRIAGLIQAARNFHPVRLAIVLVVGVALLLLLLRYA